jgi:alpha-2-macroglobulin
VFEGDKFGSGSKNVTVRDPIVLTPTLPRFVGPLDSFALPVELYNGTGKDGSFKVKIEMQGRMKVIGEATKEISAKSNEQVALQFQIQADEVAGKAKVIVRAEGNGASTFSDTELAIRPAATVTAEGSSLVARPGEPVRFKIPGNFMEGTMRVQITAGAVPAAQFGAALQYLIAYPYGCVEQTTSRAFPLIYLKDLAKTAAPELSDDKSIDLYVNAGIARLSSMLGPTGGLVYWPGSSWGYPWSTVYGAHFLVEAKKAGYEVDNQVLARLLDHLTTLTHRGAIPFYQNSWTDFRSQAYALYVLALAGKPNQSALLWAADQVRRTLEGKLKGQDAVATDDEIRALIGGALILSGEKSRAGDFISTSFQLAAQGHQSGFWSSTRADALLLSVLADVQPDHKSVPQIMRSIIDRARVGRWYNTQENSFALMALGKIGRKLGQSDFTGTIKVGGEELKRFTEEAPVSVIEKGHAFVGKEVEVSISGTGTAFVGVLVEGIRPTMIEPRSNGIEVKRTYLTKSGAPLDPMQIRQGDLVVTKIELKSPAGTRLENVAIVDLLPAGLEIENPRLAADHVEPWMNNRSIPQYLDIRDDRLLLFTDVAPGAPQVFYYTSRAVTSGEFVLPHVHAEAMYDPATQSDTSGGRAKVAARE